MELASAPARISVAEQQVILATLRSVIESPHFCKSKRYPSLVEFIVRDALEESPTPLKERTIGVQVFGRSKDYDTSSDPVVRVAFGEVRRRMTTYFNEHPEAPVRIDLPGGSYKAEFHFRPLPVLANSAHEPQRQTFPIDTCLDQPAMDSVAIRRAPVPSAPAVPERKRTPGWWNIKAGCAVAATLLLAVAGAGLWSSQQDRGRQEFWWPVLHGNEPAVILVGRTGPSASDGIANGRPMAVSFDPGTQSNLVLDDAIVAGQICGVFREYGHDCNVGSAQLAKAGDIRGKSVVLVGAFNNPWTARLLAPLPYHIQRDEVKKTRNILERTPTGDLPLEKLGDKDPASPSGVDYAIIARFRSDVTDGMAVVVAGLGVPGTNSAGRYLASPEKVREMLSQAPKDWKGSNFEAVLKIDVVHGSPSHVAVVASKFW